MNNSNNEEYKKNYERLIYQLKDRKIDFDMRKVIMFCNWFKSSNVEKFMEFDKMYENNMDDEEFKNLFKEMYNLPKEEATDDVISRIVFNNLIQDGMSYHITNDVSYNDFKKYGVNPTRQSEEKIELYQMFAKIPKEKRSSIITTFAADYMDENNKPRLEIFYNNDLQLNNRYGKPEWLTEMKLGIQNREYGELDDNLRGEIKQFCDKYDKKYENARRMLVMFPLRRTLEKEGIDSLRNMEANDLIRFCKAIIEGKNLSSKKFLYEDYENNRRNML